ncbi:hypothetical protein C8R47DRAFT_1107950 [Mycena vitilis]|nr:hypothetical protein C8R47DRAFT_1107950 [Mycena vitilis]
MPGFGLLLLPVWSWFSHLFSGLCASSNSKFGYLPSQFSHGRHVSFTTSMYGNGISHLFLEFLQFQINIRHWSFTQFGHGWGQVVGLFSLYWVCSGLDLGHFLFVS